MKPGVPETSEASAEKHARWSLTLGVGTLFFSVLAGVPAIVLGIGALKEASPAGKKKAVGGIVLGASISLIHVGVVTLAIMAPDKAKDANPDTTIATPSSGAARRPELPSAPVAAAAPVDSAPVAKADATPLDAWLSASVPVEEFKIGVDESWALLPAGTTDCADADGKVPRLDKPSTSDEFAAHRQEEQRGAIVKKYTGRLVRFGLRDVRIEYGDYDFPRGRMPVTVSMERPWPLGTETPKFRRESDMVETKTKIGELGGKALTVTGEQAMARYENASSMTFSPSVPDQQAEHWKNGKGDVRVTVVQRFKGLGYHKVCQHSCARILGVNTCSDDNVGVGEFNRADLIGYRIAIDDVVLGEKQPSSPPSPTE